MRADRQTDIHGLIAMLTAILRIPPVGAVNTLYGS